MSLQEIGCCGAYCGSCRARTEQACKGCKLGYDEGERDIAKARCRIKVCCIGKGCHSCADCPDLSKCELINVFFGKKGYKYRKYREALEFIRNHGDTDFVEIADTWKNAYGKYPKE
jgi:hypothetical protein